jgi:hypothetical protein
MIGRKYEVPRYARNDEGVNSEAGRSRFTLDVSHLAKGVYMLKVANGDNSKVVTFVKD